MKKTYRMNKLVAVAVVFMMILTAFSLIGFINLAKGLGDIPVTPDDDDSPPPGDAEGKCCDFKCTIYGCVPCDCGDGPVPGPVIDDDIDPIELNEDPVANPDSANVNEDSNYNEINAISNDNDPDGDAISIYAVENPAHGDTYLNAGKIYYKPDSNYFGTESFTYSISDGNGGTDSSTVTVNIAGINDAPIVSNIGNQMIDQGASFTTINLDAYVSDIDNTDAQITWTYSGNSQLIVSIVNRVATITVPNGEWYGEESITFTAKDPAMSSDYDDATFTVNRVLADISTYVNPINPDVIVGSMVTVTATLERGEVSGIELYYQYSPDQSDWGGWVQYGSIDTNAPYSWEFNFPSGSGYYQFYSLGKV